MVKLRQDGNSRDMLNPIMPLIQHIAAALQPASRRRGVHRYAGRGWPATQVAMQLQLELGPGISAIYLSRSAVEPAWRSRQGTSASPGAVLKRSVA